MIDALQRTIGALMCAVVITVADGSDVEWAWLFSAGMLIGAGVVTWMENQR